MVSLTGQTLGGKRLDFPAKTEGIIAVLIFSFSRAGGRDAQNWAEHLSKDDDHLPVYTVIFLESVPRLLRPMVVAGIKNGMPPAVQERTVIVYQQQKSWEQRLGITNENTAIVLVLGRTGRIRWISSGPFADSLYLSLKKEVQP